MSRKVFESWTRQGFAGKAGRRVDRQGIDWKWGQGLRGGPLLALKGAGQARARASGRGGS